MHACRRPSMRARLALNSTRFALPSRGLRKASTPRSVRPSASRCGLGDALSARRASIERLALVAGHAGSPVALVVAAAEVAGVLVQLHAEPFEVAQRPLILGIAEPEFA